ncbi:hypothetical protein QYE76_008944 [Lolium multiflorum]|uniref:Reverse transcriptase Ty1/copia-type domain-containing protein n=1 Tax=Lolium multiflorum TaxID=4521 RepID=A0AAD8TU86_LOLMU|nr:hypothetical protein QYE76_008944 [Lolium multiflorum]
MAGVAAPQPGGGNCLHRREPIDMAKRANQARTGSPGSNRGPQPYRQLRRPAGHRRHPSTLRTTSLCGAPAARRTQAASPSPFPGLRTGPDLGRVGPARAARSSRWCAQSVGRATLLLPPRRADLTPPRATAAKPKSTSLPHLPHAASAQRESQGHRCRRRPALPGVRHDDGGGEEERESTRRVAALPHARGDTRVAGAFREKFEMSMMGELKFFLGFQVRQLAKGTFISQEKYVKDMLKKFNMTNASPMKTPMPVKGQLGSCDGEKDVDIKVVGVVRAVAMLPREEGLLILPAVLVVAYPLKLIREMRTVNPYRYEQRTYTGGDKFFWTKTQAALWDGFYNTRECMKNGAVVMPKAINPEELALHEATKYRFVVETLKVMDRMTPNYAQYVQRLINYIVPAPLNTLDERVIMEPFKFPTQEGRPEVPSMMPSNERRSKEHHDPAASSSYSRRPKRGASRFFSSLWQMCKNTNDVAHQSLALNQETRRRQNEFMAARNAPVPPSGPEMEPVVAPAGRCLPLPMRCSRTLTSPCMLMVVFLLGLLVYVIMMMMMKRMKQCLFLSSSVSSGLSLQSFSSSEPEWNFDHVPDGPPEAFVGSDGDLPLTDGEDDLKFLIEGELISESEDDLHPWVKPTSSDGKEEEEEVEEEEEKEEDDSSSSAGYPPAKRFRAWADSEDDDDDEEEEEEDESSSSIGYPPTKRFRSWADSEDDDDDEEEEAPAEGWGSSDEELPGSSADDIDDGDDEDSDN